MEDKLKIKFNSGMGAILCSDCSKILKVGWQFTDEETKFFTNKLDYLPPQYCEHCKGKRNEPSTTSCNIKSEEA